MQVYSSFNSRQNKNFYKQPFYKSSGFLFLSAILIGLIGFVIWAIVTAPEKPTESLQDLEQKNTFEAGTITFVKGSLWIKKDEWALLESNQKITTGDTIKTEKDSKAIVQLPDNSLLRMDQNTEVYFEKFSPGEIIIEQKSGNIYHRINDSSPAIYRVKINQVEFTALGTGFNTGIQNNQISLAVIESRIKVKIFDAPGSDNIINMRTIEQSEIATIDLSKPTTEMITSEKKQITDFLANSWLVWNKEQDETAGLIMGLYEANVELKILEPQKNDFTTNLENLIIKGTTDPQAEIYISGKEVKNNAGQFEYPYLLTTGDNQIEITVKLGSKLNKQIIYVKFDQAQSPLEVNLSSQGTKILVNWSSKTEMENVIGFRIYYSQSPLTDLTKADSLTAETTDTGKEIEVENNKKYYIKVCILGTAKCLYTSEEKSIVIGTPKDDKIVLTGNVSAGDVNLSWKYTNEEISEFKVLIGENSNPTFPTNSSHTVAKNKFTDQWKDLEPGDYHFRICAFQDNECLLYSNNLPLNIPTPEQATGTINLSGLIQDNGISLSWTTENISAPKGYKVLMSNDPKPTFPGAEFRLLTSENDYSYLWSGLATGQTYYFRVCINNGDDCGLYSNEKFFYFE